VQQQQQHHRRRPSSVRWQHPRHRSLCRGVLGGR
jgi:hypothetical protein